MRRKTRADSVGEVSDFEGWEICRSEGSGLEVKLQSGGYWEGGRRCKHGCKLSKCGHVCVQESTWGKREKQEESIWRGVRKVGLCSDGKRDDSVTHNSCWIWLQSCRKLLRAEERAVTRLNVTPVCVKGTVQHFWDICLCAFLAQSCTKRSGASCWLA